VMFDEVNRIGELYVGGVQLMDGYWGDWKLSEQVLRDDVVPGERVYRTGDLVYREAGGDYVYVNRADRVVKRNGVRISLIELDETVRGLPHVNAVACLLFDDDGTPGIVAFVVTDGHVARDEVINGMMKRLPESMMPNPVEIIESLPMTNSNKLDERLLLSRVHLHPLRAPGLGTT